MITLLPFTGANVTVGKVSATVTASEAVIDELRLAVTVADPFGSVTASISGIVAVQPVPAELTVAV